MRYLSICSGIEAATVAWHPLGWQPVAFAEIDRFPSAVLAYHYPEVPNLGDFTKITRGDLRSDIDLLVGGTPCQDFSVAGLRAGVDGDRGNLTLEFLKLAQRLRPRWVVWENVPGVLSSTSHRAPDPCPPPPPLDLGCGGAEMDTQDEYGGEELHAFNCLLAGFSELGYGWAYRVLDAQYVRVDGYARAVPQRRRRVFVVGYLGDWRRAAAVLFEREGLSGNPAPRREAGQRSAPTLAARTRGGGGLGADFDLDGGLIAGTLGTRSADHPSGVKSESEFLVPVSHTLSAARGKASAHDHTLETYVPVARCVTARQTRIDAESETLIAFSSKDHGADATVNVAPTLRAMGHNESHANAGGQLAVAHTLKGGGFDASEDGTGRGTPLIPVSGTLGASLDRGGTGDPCHPITDGSTIGVMTGWRVRRLMPVECERLQGFPDGYTDIPWRGGGRAPDGPRYRALGNSKAVNCPRWIGIRIAIVDKIGEPA